MIGISGDWNSNAGYLTSIRFHHGDTRGNGKNSDLFITPRKSGDGGDCGESVYYNKDVAMLQNGAAAQAWTDLGVYFDFDNPEVYGVT